MARQRCRQITTPALAERPTAAMPRPSRSHRRTLRVRRIVQPFVAPLRCAPIQLAGEDGACL